MIKALSFWCWPFLSRHAYCLKLELLYIPLQPYCKHMSWLNHFLIWETITWYLTCAKHNVKGLRSHPNPLSPCVKWSRAYPGLALLCCFGFPKVISTLKFKTKNDSQKHSTEISFYLIILFGVLPYKTLSWNSNMTGQWR